MLRTVLLSKIHRANVTFRDLNYVGSITIDKNLLEATGMKLHEKVEIYNISNGNRFATYIFEGEAGSGVIGVNGAAARLVSIGDKIIIVNYGQLNEEEIKDHKPKVIVIKDKKNLKFTEV
ncbi:MAG: aspartate 1-decarboxylase [Candidatus Cloacimonetes bacterium]|nr:aspartate 1-decarboxylase [Candidatus Cloacimonadota bacterium]